MNPRQLFRQVEDVSREQVNRLELYENENENKRIFEDVIIKVFEIKYVKCNKFHAISDSITYLLLDKKVKDKLDVKVNTYFKVIINNNNFTLSNNVDICYN